MVATGVVAAPGAEEVGTPPADEAPEGVSLPDAVGLPGADEAGAVPAG